MINFAHRGASSDYPENTLLAFEEGISVEHQELNLMFIKQRIIR